MTVTQHPALLPHQLGVGLDHLAGHFLCFGDLIGSHFFDQDVYVFTSSFKSKNLRNWEYIGPFYKSDRKWTSEGRPEL